MSDYFPSPAGDLGCTTVVWDPRARRSVRRIGIVRGEAMSHK